MKFNKKNICLNNKGFAITSIIYSMLFLSIILITTTLLILMRRKVLLDRTKEDAKSLLNEYSETYYYDYTNNYQEFIVPKTGYYKVELWGAQGGSNEVATGGKGAYTTGKIYLNEGTKLYLYIGGMGAISKDSVVTAGYNGGGSGATTDPLNTNEIFSQYGGGGGGATDIRLVSGEWNDQNSLKSRIMVAAGGSGASNGENPKDGSAGGTLLGIDGTSNTNGQTNLSTGATQISGGSGASNGSFGIGATPSSNYGSGAGGGYYGGGSGFSQDDTIITGSSGSSFISGYDGCIAISEDGNPTTQSIHYSNFQFESSNMISGDSYMPGYNNNTSMLGNSGNGAAKITYIGKKNVDKIMNVISENIDDAIIYPITINKNSFTFSGLQMTHTLDIDAVGYMLNWNFNVGIMNIKFCDLSNNCTNIASISGNKPQKGNFISTELGSLVFELSGCTGSVENITYNGTPVEIKNTINFPPPTSGKFSFLSNCTIQGSSFTNCTHVTNGSTVNGQLVITYPNSQLTLQIKVDDGEWDNMNVATNNYYIISNTGTHKIKFRYKSNDIYSVETDEYTFTIQ